jgi:hypothetical protein
MKVERGYMDLMVVGVYGAGAKLNILTGYYSRRRERRRPEQKAVNSK